MRLKILTLKKKFLKEKVYPILDTRVECKVALENSVYKALTIGIYPEWNVKAGSKVHSNSDTQLEYIQNGM